jgi:hypothetical protein
MTIDSSTTSTAGEVAKVPSLASSAVEELRLSGNDPERRLSQACGARRALLRRESCKPVPADGAINSMVRDRFDLILMCAVGLTGLCGILMGAIAVYGPNPQPPPIAAVLDTLKYGFTLGMLSIFGLLGTRSRNPPTKMHPIK